MAAPADIDLAAAALSTDVVFELGADCDERSVFVLEVDRVITPAIAESLLASWAMAWPGRTPPKLLVFERDMELSMLTGDQLRLAGLARIQ